MPQKSRRGTPSSMVRRSSRSVMAAQWGTGKMPGGGVKTERSCQTKRHIISVATWGSKNSSQLALKHVILSAVRWLNCALRNTRNSTWAPSSLQFQLATKDQHRAGSPGQCHEASFLHGPCCTVPCPLPMTHVCMRSYVDLSCCSTQ